MCAQLAAIASHGLLHVGAPPLGDRQTTFTGSSPLGRRHELERNDMGMPYRARINERTLLNLPGFHGGAYVYVYIEDTSERGLAKGPYCDNDCSCCPANFEPRMSLEIADCHRTVELEFDVDTPEGRENSLHKLDTLEIAIRVFRDAFIAEFEPYDRREQTLESLRG